MTRLAEERAACLNALRCYDRPLLTLGETPSGAAADPLLGALTDDEVPAALVTPLGAGLINQTFLVDTAGLAAGEPKRAVLQRVNPLFGFAVNHDIAAITHHLQQRGLPTPLLYRTRAGLPAADLGTAGVWRLMTLVPGVTFHKVTPALAHEAGALVARFHRSLLDCNHHFQFTRPGAHDLTRHLTTLRTAVANAANAAHVPADFAALAAEILARASGSPLTLEGPLRLCHGDLKISNLLFLPKDAGYQGHCLVDLDTLAYLPLALELGDALRSWCNPDDENTPGSRFDLDLFGAAIAGYASHGAAFVSAAEQQQLVAGTLRVTLQLAARFAADVVNQSYFGWDTTRYPSRAAHNFVRARSQLSLARSLGDQRTLAEAVVARRFHPL